MTGWYILTCKDDSFKMKNQNYLIRDGNAIAVEPEKLAEIFLEFFCILCKIVKKL